MRLVADFKDSLTEELKSALENASVAHAHVHNTGVQLIMRRDFVHERLLSGKPLVRTRRWYEEQLFIDEQLEKLNTARIALVELGKRLTRLVEATAETNRDYPAQLGDDDADDGVIDP